MCGIAGIWQFSHHQDQRDSLNQMLDSIAHRGPDGEGLWSDSSQGVYIGHRRLAVIDRSNAGHQPMHINEQQVVLSFNGEIYNYIELRQELINQGIQFSSNSDTEVLLQGYLYWGRKILDKLVGMFAFAIWDNKLKQLFVARDRTGEKPLYYTHGAGYFAFASELTALKYVAGFKAAIDPEAVALYLMLCNVPAPKTIFKNSYKLLPAHAMLITLDKLEIWRYWQPLDFALQPRMQITEDEATEALEKLLLQAVKGQLRADESPGAFLSGGTDSSLIVSLMAEISPERVKTFTIGFDSKEDEVPFAKAIAKHLGTDHSSTYMNTQEVLKTLPHMPIMFGEPFADPTALATHFVAKIARQKVIVSLSGDGGDEAFGGYSSWHRNFEHYLRLRLDSPAFSAFRPLAKRLPQRLGRAGLLLGKQPSDIFLAFMSIYCADEIERMTGTKPYYASYEALWQIKAPISDHRRCLTAVLLTWLPDYILPKTDRTSMAASLELRAPLLDHRLLEYSLQLPDNLVRDKQLLKNVLYKRVPHSLMGRPKLGFALPLAQWLKHELKEPLHTAITPSRLAAIGVEPTYAKQLMKEHMTGQRNHHRRLWALWVLSDWVNHFS